jgi:hypothetical protein
MYMYKQVTELRPFTAIKPTYRYDAVLKGINMY